MVNASLVQSSLASESAGTSASETIQHHQTVLLLLAAALGVWGVTEQDFGSCKAYNIYAIAMEQRFP
jgi:hypothetical protein